MKIPLHILIPSIFGVLILLIVGVLFWKYCNGSDVENTQKIESPEKAPTPPPSVNSPNVKDKDSQKIQDETPKDPLNPNSEEKLKSSSLTDKKDDKPPQSDSGHVNSEGPLINETNIKIQTLLAKVVGFITDNKDFDSKSDDEKEEFLKKLEAIVEILEPSSSKIITKVSKTSTWSDSFKDWCSYIQYTLYNTYEKIIERSKYYFDKRQ